MAQSVYLTVVKSGPYSANPGSTITHTLWVTNSGPDNIQREYLPLD